MGCDSDVLMWEGLVSFSCDGRIAMDSESALKSSCCSSGCGIVSPDASAARCLAAGISGPGGEGVHGHQRTWSAYFC